MRAKNFLPFQSPSCSAEYCDTITEHVANELVERVNDFVASGASSIDSTTKIDADGNTSPVTPFDQNTEAIMGLSYYNSGTRVKGEEDVAFWPIEERPTHIAHVDPIDGTRIFITYLESLLEWSRLPEDGRPPRPTVGSMVSTGVSRNRRNAQPRIGSIAAPFMDESGVVRWLAGPHTPAVRIEPDGSRHQLRLAKNIPIPKDTEGQVILVASEESADRLRQPLKRRNLEVLHYGSAVAIAACVMDPDLFERLQPGVLDGRTIVGAAMRSAKPWDVAATQVLARNRRVFARDAQGGNFRAEGGVFTLRPHIGRTVLEALANQ